ncbi:MAG: DNA polymerase III subunit beta [Clostridia bacterium]|nr:DNA polymerase III subunit beta [Clostridia bacterium]
MKAVCEGIDLSDAVLKVVKACASKTTVPVLECIKISAVNDTLTLSATDGEISIQKSIKAEIYEEGDVCVPGRYFSDFIKKLEGVQITLSADNKKMDINYADSQTDMQILSAEDFPKIDLDIKENSFKVKTADLKKFISSTSFCCATDDSRPILKGCQFVISGDDICVTSLDGFRLATVKGKVVSSTGDLEIVCPARTLVEIEKMMSDAEEFTEVFVQRGMILVSEKDTVLTSRLYNGDFIKKENIIPKDFTTLVTVNKDALKASIERAAILVRNDKNSLIIFDVSGDKIEISSNSDIGNVQEPVKAVVNGKDVRIAMNSKFIIEAVNALTEDEILLSFNNQIQPFTCENLKDRNGLYLILPVRTANNA